MKAADILKHTDHRTGPLPNKNWQWYQEWNDTVFLHGSVDAELLLSYLPQGTQLDLHEGKAWISVVVFKMEGVRHKYSPSFPPVSDFYEINIRTYVTDGKMPGVLFLNMEGAKWLSSWLAMNLSGLPYVFERMHCKDGSFESKGISYKYRPGKMFERNEIANWLTERYSVYFSKNGKTFRYQVHHNMWPLQEVELSDLNINYPLLNELNWKPELFHYSPGVQVVTFPAECL